MSWTLLFYKADTGVSLPCYSIIVSSEIYKGRGDITKKALFPSTTCPKCVKINLLNNEMKDFVPLKSWLADNLWIILLTVSDSRTDNMRGFKNKLTDNLYFSKSAAKFDAVIDNKDWLKAVSSWQCRSRAINLTDQGLEITMRHLNMNIWSCLTKIR